MSQVPSARSDVSSFDPHEGADDPRYRARRQPEGRSRRRKLSVTTVLGELLLTAGVLVLGFIVWQPLWSSTVVASEQRSSAQVWSDKWQKDAEGQPAPTMTDGDIPIPGAVAAGEPLGVIYVPAFGADFSSAIGETTDLRTVLNKRTLGTGHYELSQQPGEIGNFAMAAHRSGWVPTPFREIMNLRIGDPIFIQTPAGWYTYRFRDLEYVQPTQTDVLNPFPRLEGTPGTDRILTMTTCHPKLAGSDERAIGYAVFDNWQALQDGPPAELVELNPNVKA
ncbi:class E sortase [Klugiella xanthotipulae]|nr:class E sortase [Klugiella xanthotipulae]